MKSRFLEWQDTSDHFACTRYNRSWLFGNTSRITPQRSFFGGDLGSAPAERHCRIPGTIDRPRNEPWRVTLRGPSRKNRPLSLVPPGPAFASAHTISAPGARSLYFGSERERGTLRS